MPKWTKIGAVLASKDGKSSYIKIGFLKPRDGTEGLSSVTLTDGQIVRVQDPRKSKFLTDEQREKIPSFVKAELFLVPEQSETPTESSSS